METKNIMIVGVGGQGTLLASKMLGRLLLSEGYDVKVSEVHGMSQRGGSVVTYVRFGDKVYSPLIDKGEADFILSFEQLEAARWLPYLKLDGQIILNDQQIDPMPVVTGAARYPDGVVEKLRAAERQDRRRPGPQPRPRSGFPEGGQHRPDGAALPLFPRDPGGKVAGGP